MDIYCRHCGEPWDHDELHDLPIPYNLASQEFRTFGCGVFDFYWDSVPSRIRRAREDHAGKLGPWACDHKQTDPDRAEFSAICYALLGDDLDAAASMLDDD